MRERTTWNRERVAASLKKVAEDPRAMNQDHLQQQPAADDYLIGDGTPSEFAEDVHPEDDNWKAEQGAGGDTARDEIGLPDMRDDTFNHPTDAPGSTPTRSASLDVEAVNKKAELATKVARVMLKGASESAIEDQGLALMDLPESTLQETYTRLAAQNGEDGEEGGSQQGDDDQGKEAGQQQQQAQGQDDDKKDDDQGKEAAKKSQDGQQQQGQQQGQGQGQGDDDQGKEAAKKSQEQGQGQQQTQGQQDDDDQGKEAGQQQQQAQGQDDDKKSQQQEQAKEAAIAAIKKAGLDPMAQQQLMSQVQQLVEQAMQNQQGQGQQQMQQGQQQMQQGQDPGMGMLSEQELMDQMIQDQSQQVLAESDIQMDTPHMDVGDVVLSQQDHDVLSQVFASNAEVQNAMTAQAIENGGTPVHASQPAPQSGMTRTAATRTVGTRPTAGVSQLGGGTAPAAEGDDINKLSSLWSSAPDVSSAFS